MQYIGLNEAISHARDVAENRADLCAACRSEHGQLADWLKELQQYRDTSLSKDEVNEELKAYQALGDIDHLTKLVEAEKAKRLVILPDEAYTDADGEKALKAAMWKVGNTNNGANRFAVDAILEKLCPDIREKMVVRTPLGDLVAEVSTDSAYPGIWISFHRNGKDYEPSLALVEFVDDEADVDGEHLIARIWGNAKQDDYTDRVVYTGLDEAFG